MRLRLRAMSFSLARAPHIARNSAIVLLLLAAGSAWSATAEDLVREVDAALASDEDATPTLRATAIAAMLGGAAALAPVERAALHLAIAEAWIDAGDSEKAEASIKAALADPAATPALRERAGLAFIAAWQDRLRRVEPGAAVPGLDAGLKPLGDLGPKVAARAACAQAQRLLAETAEPPAKPGEGPAKAAVDPALVLIDQALALLVASPPDERIPVYSLRLLAMERSGAKAEAVQAWLASHQADPAAATLAELALTGNQKLVGQKAPALPPRRLDGAVDPFTAPAGQPMLVYFFATWSQASTTLTPHLANAAKAVGASLVGVSLDNQDTRDRLMGYAVLAGIDLPIVGEGVGWDGDADDAWHIDVVPSLIAVDAKGIIRAVDLAQGPPEQVVQRVVAAFGGAPPAGQPLPKLKEKIAEPAEVVVP
ncbi:hypothetical protein LBMAG53_18490 [Planctomycetota bacterium]|nr:hypothetical protein LBMAG53_18490 [Planctomycetota bacterium]